MSYEDFSKAEAAEGIYPPSPQHVFAAGRCLHCGCDDHSTPNPGEDLATWEKSCAVDGPERVTGWSFGLGAPGLDELSEDELEAFPSHAIF